MFKNTISNCVKFDHSVILKHIHHLDKVHILTVLLNPFIIILSFLINHWPNTSSFLKQKSILGIFSFLLQRGGYESLMCHVVNPDLHLIHCSLFDITLWPLFLHLLLSHSTTHPNGQSSAAGWKYIWEKGILHVNGGTFALNFWQGTKTTCSGRSSTYGAFATSIGGSRSTSVHQHWRICCQTTLGRVYKYSSCIFKTNALVYVGFVRSLASMAMAKQLLVYDCSRTRLWMIRIR